MVVVDNLRISYLINILLVRLCSRTSVWVQNAELRITDSPNQYFCALNVYLLNVLW